jgi:hypothetical protein
VPDGLEATSTGSPSAKEIRGVAIKPVKNNVAITAVSETPATMTFFL